MQCQLFIIGWYRHRYSSVSAYVPDFIDPETEKDADAVFYNQTEGIGRFIDIRIISSLCYRPISTIGRALTIIVMINKQSVSFLSFRGAWLSFTVCIFQLNKLNKHTDCSCCCLYLHLFSFEHCFGDRIFSIYHRNVKKNIWVCIITLFILKISSQLVHL